MGNNGCDEHKTGCCNRPNGCPVGMVYGVSQMWQDIYEVDAGFPRGTIFKELDLPLYRTGCNDKGGCRG
ncbi:MAG: spore coat associated protein CotJA [Clostridia bacterium]|nr:spore coat associated protein CotJA [Clostridia bacterium]